MEQDTIRVRRIELVDENGTKKAVLRADSQVGVTGLVVTDTGGTGMSATIGLNSSGYPLLLLDSEDRGNVYARITSDGPFVRVTNENGEFKTLEV